MSKNINKRVAIVGNLAYTLIRFRGNLIKALVERGHTVYALVPDAGESDKSKIRELGAEPVHFSLDRSGVNPVRDFKDLLRLVRVFNELKVDISFCYFLKPVIYGTLAAWLARVPRRYCLIEGAGITFSEGGTKRTIIRFIVKKLCRLALKRAQRIFFLNSDDRKMFVDEGLVREEATSIIPGIGIDLTEYELTPLTSENTTFVMATRLLGTKGVREYVQAAKILKKQYLECKFLLLGGLETNPDRILEDEVKDWHQKGIVEWLGHVEDVRPYLIQSTVFVLPSYYREGLPRSTMEAMAVGRAVITTDWVGCRDTVDDGKNGILVPIRDPTALVAAMERFITDKGLAVRMGLESRKIVEQRFEVNEINRRFLKEMEL